MNCVIEQETPEIKAQSIATVTLSDTLTLSNKEGAVQKTDIKTIRTTCPYCGVGCGVLATVDQNSGDVSVKGDPDHPANYGKLCSKGSALAETLGIERRITQPYYNQSYYYKNTRGDTPIGSNSPPTQSQINLVESATTPADWDVVLDDIATRLNDTIAEHGRDSIMFYVSGQLLTEDYYVANKFIKGFIGNNNIDSNSRLCMSSAVAGHKRAFGADLVPGNYEDLEACELLVLVGSNMAWCHPILFGRFLKAKQANPDVKLVVIDPRRTDSCEFADLHLPIAAGTDTHLYNGLLNYLEQQGCRDTDYAEQCEGLECSVAAAQDWSLLAVASACDVDEATIRQFYELVAATPKTVNAFSMGVNQSSSGTDKVNAIINTHLLTGRVGKVGASPFSLTGQPNAMGGREVGALANLLAAHLDLANADHRQAVADFWQAPQAINSEHGVKACDATDAILDGRIKAIWIMATNPVVSLPEADKFRRALAECDLVIVSDCSKDSDTVGCADVVLPAQGWGEKSGTVTNSERRISRQRSLLPPVGEAKPDWWILSQVAQRMGLDGFDYNHPSEIFNEHMALTAWRNEAVADSNDGIPRYLNLAHDLAHHLDIASSEKVSNVELSPDDYDTLPPFQWGGSRINMVDESCATTKAQLISITPPDNASAPNFHHAKTKKGPLKSREEVENSSTQAQSTKAVANLRLITGRLRDQWHTMTRTGLAPQLNQQQSVPTLTLHPQDAQQLGVSEQDFVQIDPRHNGIEGDELLQTNTIVSHVMAQVAISDSMRVGDAFMPMHWSDAFAHLARVGSLIPTVVDPHSSQPELKNSAISVSPVAMQSVGKILVHPDWQDAMVVQLRTLLAKFSDESDTHSVSEQYGLPALTWSLSRQKDSVLFNIASPLAEVSSAWLEPEFWQQWLESLPLGRSGDREQIQTDPNAPTATAIIKSEEIDAPPLLTAFIVNEQQGQLRFIATQEAHEQIETAQTEATQATSDAEATDNSDDKSLIFAVYIAPSYPQLPSTHWLDSCFADISQVPSPKWLLAGRPASGYIDPGPLVCACMSVGENIIINAITEQGCHSAKAVGEQCRAGTNCGSCVGQINDLVAEYA
ncbi:nitrate reductase [Psychrobacter arenosus]|uniref:nitrate reductase n=1 Tax=Psychrobacter arenosus TaxID=256326 RepID=UPI00191958D8|nr:nitrate reductase [Psychrobacter arenosus]